MATIKKNIWLLFYIILFMGTVIFATLSYLKWQDIHSEFEAENEAIAKLVANSTKTYFDQLEMLLKILGERLSSDNQYSDFMAAKKIFKELIKMDPSIAGFGLVDPSGTYTMFSGEVDQLDSLPNLLELPSTQETFKEALKSERMVLGRTYYFPPLQALVIPARKAIHDQTGKVIAVMTLGINVSKINFINADLLFSAESVIQLFRATDKRRQLLLALGLEVTDESLYNEPIDAKSYNQLTQYIVKKYGKDISSIKSSGMTITYEVENPSFLKDRPVTSYMTSNVFVPGHNLWTLSQIPHKVIQAQFNRVFIIYLSIFLILNATLYMMFKYIAGFEEAKRETLRYQATHDPLTKLVNRQFLLDYTNKWLSQHPCCSVLFVDLDDFKYANDSFGHEIGDIVLKKVAERLNSTIVKGDLVARHGGDEFVILSQLTHKVDLKAYSETIIEELSKPYHVQDLTILLGASIGISLFPDDGTKLTDLISCADVALYEAKKEKNAFCIFESALKQDLLDKIELENQMKLALQQNEFFMNYQPQLNSDGTLYGVEALIRWRNEKLGFVSPDRFIPLAEHNGFITFLGNFVLDRVLQETYLLQRRMGTTFQVSINISLRQFMENDFFHRVLNKIEEIGIEPTTVTLEITESLYIQDLEYVINLLNQFKKIGIRISMDDFGTGYSSLSILNRLPIDELKIDKQFIDDILTSKPALNMVESIVHIGKSYGFHLLAEGVEDQKQVKILDRLGCKIYQGYHYSKPLGIADLETYIQNLAHT